MSGIIGGFLAFILVACMVGTVLIVIGGIIIVPIVFVKTIVEGMKEGGEDG